LSEKSIPKGMVGLFTTPVFLSSIVDEKIVTNAAETILKLKETTEGWQRIGNWVSDDNLHTLPEFKELTDIILAESERALDAMTIKRDSHYISCMWANVAPIGTAHNEHIHSNCIYSGVIYIRTPPGSGPTLFSDPRPAVGVIRPDYEDPSAFYVGARWGQVPEEGNMIIFPGWLPHSVEQVEPQPDALERIVISFNIMIKSKVQFDTAKIEFK
jgi:uncharacterized protein (TIGR02466 family)